MIKFFIRFFDRLEDRIRSRLSRRSILYGTIGGTLTVLFWRSVWHTADKIMMGMDLKSVYQQAESIFERNGFLSVLFYEPITLIWTLILLLLTGLFVSITIGEKIILSGIKHEKRTDEKTEEEIRKEEVEIKNLAQKISIISKDLEEIKELLKK